MAATPTSLTAPTTGANHNATPAFSFAPNPQAFVDGLESIALEALGAAALMNRIDRKFTFPAERLPEVFALLGNGYRVLEVGGRRISRYHTRYFDTPALAFYHAHHAGWARRVKVRVRSYLDSDQAFLEVKLKTRGRTHKERVPLAANDPEPMARLQANGEFATALPTPVDELSEALEVAFERITLVARDAAERITLDQTLSFSRGDVRQDFPGLVVAEVKQSGRAPSPFLEAMRAMRIREGSVSKYCLGIATLEPNARSNQFRQALRQLRRSSAPAPQLMETQCKP